MKRYVMVTGRLIDFNSCAILHFPFLQTNFSLGLFYRTYIEQANFSFKDWIYIPNPRVNLLFIKPYELLFKKIWSETQFFYSNGLNCHEWEILKFLDWKSVFYAFLT